MNSNGNYKIKNVGAYYVGHFNAIMYKIDFGNPNTCLSTTFRLTSDAIPKIIKALGIDAEDGVWVHDALIDMPVCLEFDEEGYLISVSDIFGQNKVKIDPKERAL